MRPPSIRLYNSVDKVKAVFVVLSMVGPTSKSMKEVKGGLWGVAFSSVLLWVNSQLLLVDDNTIISSQSIRPFISLRGLFIIRVRAPDAWDSYPKRLTVITVQISGGCHSFVFGGSSVYIYNRKCFKWHYQILLQ